MGLRKKKKNILEQKQDKLRSLQSKSNRALDVVNSTINQLATTNEEIDVTISEITELEIQFKETREALEQTRTHNAKVSAKFKALIEDDYED